MSPHFWKVTWRREKPCYCKNRNGHARRLHTPRVKIISALIKKIGTTVSTDSRQASVNMSEPNQLKQILGQLAAPKRRHELAELYHKALRQTLFSSRAAIRPATLKSIAEAEVEAVLECFRAFDPAQARQRGVQLCQAGLGSEALLHLAQVTRHFCLASLPEDLRLPALEVVEPYHSAVMQGFTQTGEAITLEEQERIRSAFQTNIQRYAAQTALAAEIAGAATSILDMDELLATSVESIQARFALYYAASF